MSLKIWLLAPVAIALVAAACVGGGNGDDEATPGQTPEPPDADGDFDDEIPPVQGWETDWSKRTIDLSELVLGIQRADPRDSIPPIDDPAFETVDEASEWLTDREPVIALTLEDEARAYPLRILNLHEIVNDVVGGRPVAITFCPLCNSAVTFDREVNGQVLRFGVSGLLRNSDLVMWDRQTESLWQQITGEGIVGELAGTDLTFIPSPVVAWGDFRERYPEGGVLSRAQGIYPAELYDTQPYVGYDSANRPFLFGDEVDDRFPAMERVVGVRVNGETKAYPFSVISEEGAVNDEVGGRPILVLFGAEDTASVLDSRDVSQGRAVGVGLAFERMVGDRVLTFETRGGDLFVDQETGTTWDLLGVAVEGPLAGEKLTPMIGTNELWFAWAAFNQGAPVYEGG